VVIGRTWHKSKHRNWTGASVGNALQQPQAIARPSIEFQVEQKLKHDKEEDDEGGPDDPTGYLRQLPKNLDHRNHEGKNSGES
jgi:hypothetical protein